MIIIIIAKTWKFNLDDLLNVFAKFTGAKIIKSFNKIQMKDIGFAKKVILHKTSDDPFAKDKIILN